MIAFFSYLKGENVMRKRSMAFMMSLLIVLCTTPFVNANTGTEFDDSKSDVSCEWIQDDELLVKDGTDLSRIKIDENMVTVTNLKTETEEYFYISEGKVHSSITGETVSVLERDSSEITNSDSAIKKAYKSKTRTTKITYAKIKKLAGGSAGLATIAASIVALLGAAGFLCPGATPQVLSLISGIAGFASTVMKGSSKYGIKTTLKSYKRNVKGDIMECWKVTKIVKY